MNKLVPNMRGLPARGFLCALALALAGCTAAEQKPTIIQPVTQPMAYREPAPTYSNPGSIFSESEARGRYRHGQCCGKRKRRQ